MSSRQSHQPQSHKLGTDDFMTTWNYMSKSPKTHVCMCTHMSMSWPKHKEQMISCQHEITHQTCSKKMETQNQESLCSNLHMSETLCLCVCNQETRKRMQPSHHVSRQNFYTVMKFAHNVPFLTCQHDRKCMLLNAIVGQVTHPHFCKCFTTKKTTCIEIFKIN